MTSLASCVNKLMNEALSNDEWVKYLRNLDDGVSKSIIS